MVSEQPEVPQDVIDAMGFVLRQHVDIELDLLKASLAAGSAFRGSPQPKAPTPVGACYEASWGWGHVKPGCCCPR